MFIIIGDLHQLMVLCLILEIPALVSPLPFWRYKISAQKVVHSKILIKVSYQSEALCSFWSYSCRRCKILCLFRAAKNHFIKNNIIFNKITLILSVCISLYIEEFRQPLDLFGSLQWSLSWVQGFSTPTSSLNCPYRPLEA